MQIDGRARRRERANCIVSATAANSDVANITFKMLVVLEQLPHFIRLVCWPELSHLQSHVILRHPSEERLRPPTTLFPCYNPHV